MRLSEPTRRSLGGGLSLLAVGAIDAWALSHMRGPVSGVAGLAGTVGLFSFAAALSPQLESRRQRSIATALVLVGVAVVTSAVGLGQGARYGFLVASGAVLFCAAETADRALDRPRRAEARPGVGRFGATAVLGVAAGAGSVSYLAISARGALGGGGPAALAAGTLGAILVAALTTAMLRAGANNDN